MIDILDYFKLNTNSELEFKSNDWQSKPELLAYAVLASVVSELQLSDYTYSLIDENKHLLAEADTESVSVLLITAIQHDKCVEIIDALHRVGLLHYFLTPLDELDFIEVIDSKGHKNTYTHSLGVLSNIVKMGITDPVLRWAALFHDLGKLPTKHWTGHTWTYNSHAEYSFYLTRDIISKYSILNEDDSLRLLKLVKLHMRPIVLVDDVITDSAVRRLIAESEPYVDDLMKLCMADVTTINSDHKKEVNDNLKLVTEKIAKVREVDKYRRLQLPMPTSEIMEKFKVTRSPEFTSVLLAVKHKIIDEHYPNTQEKVLTLIEQLLKDHGLIQ